MDFTKTFRIASTGQRVSSLYAEPELTIYPATGRMRLTRKALKFIGAEAGSFITVFSSGAMLAFISDGEGKCKVDKNGNFTVLILILLDIGFGLLSM
ncbi:MAG: hypothetical protein P1P82_17035 [Bacteroidales bacterium]|nr:hypothetical protein [Bacteroidales bacterium]